MKEQNIIIGLDFGNYCTVLSCVDQFYSVSNTTDMMRLLMPYTQDGIPSVYFYSQKRGTLYGKDAVSMYATPAANRLRYLKRRLGETATVDGKEILIDEAITDIIQHCVRLANEQLMLEFGKTTNLVTLAYPASYKPEQLQKLITLAEKATLPDGTHIRVCSTIVAPAAAAIDYLEAHGRPKTETTVLTYDLGGGSFGLSLVKIHPNGCRDESGALYYYDIIAQAGLSNIGGIEFDRVMYELLLEKADRVLNGAQLSDHELNMLRDQEAEQAKIELSKFNATYLSILHNDKNLNIEVTRAEFEERARYLLRRTISLMRNMLSDHYENAPNFIIITGGSSEMPMVEKNLKAAFPEYAGRIILHRPRRAISFGAARFGASQQCRQASRSDTHSEPAKPEQNTANESLSLVQPNLKFDIGIRVSDYQKNRRFIETLAPAGSPLPYESPYYFSETSVDQQRFSVWSVYRSIVARPDPYKIDEHYTKIMDATIDHGVPLPKGTETKSRMLIDTDGRIKIESTVCKPADDGMGADHARSHKRIAFDIGVRLLNPDRKERFIETLAPAGTTLPYESPYHVFPTVADHQRTSFFPIFEAKTENPDPYKPDEDYSEILQVTVDHGKAVPKGTQTKSKMIINEDGFIKIESFNAQGEKLVSHCLMRLQHLKSENEGV